MKLIKPSFEILTPINKDYILELLETAGRTCYNTEMGSTQDFVKKRIDTGHESVIEHYSLTVRFICDRGVSHELVRHRLASFSQESTRYCNYSKDQFDNQLTFIIPCWMNLEEGVVKGNGLYDAPTRQWVSVMANAEFNYNLLIKEHGWKAQEARSVLPNSLKTEIVMTANIREWRTIFKQRTSPAAHSQMRELMVPLLAELKEKLPVLFDDINP